MNKNVIKSEDFKKRIEEAFKEAKVKRDAISIAQHIVTTTPSKEKSTNKVVEDLSGKMIPPTKEEKLNMVASFYESLEKLQSKKNLEDIKMQKVYFTDGEIYNYPKKPNN